MKKIKKYKIMETILNAMKYFDNFDIDLYIKIIKQRKQIDDELRERDRAKDNNGV